MGCAVATRFDLARASHQATTTQLGLHITSTKYTHCAMELKFRKKIITVYTHLFNLCTILLRQTLTSYDSKWKSIRRALHYSKVNG